MEDGSTGDFDELSSIKGKSESEFTFFMICPENIRDDVKAYSKK